jgi:crotonobetainyl-CoA:carnitine CoA-transferase CaiB-like acyl-CoA transferase
MIKPFADIRVLDASRLLAGPYCAQLLGDLGADVVKVESLEGDDSRRLGPPFVNDQGIFFHSANGGKRSIAIDLRVTDGLAAFLKLAQQADVVIENFRPNVADRLGIGYSKIAETNPRVVYCSISGFGHSGELSSRGGVDTVFQAMGGLVSLIGDPSAGPTKVGSPIADITAAQSAAFAISAALFERERNGKGAHIRVSIRDALVALLAPVATYTLLTGQNPPNWGNASQFAAPADILSTRDGHIAISTINNRHWQKLCSLIGAPRLVDDPRFREPESRINNRIKLTAELCAILAAETTAHWEAVLASSGIPYGPILRMNDVVADPQVAANGLLASVNGRSAVGLPFSVDGGSLDFRADAPKLGEHTDLVLASLGYPAEEIAGMRRRGTVI